MLRKMLCKAGCALILLMLPMLVGCPSTKIIVPPITESAAKISLPGKFVWFDLFTTDMTAAANFYGALFGWEDRRTNENDASVKTFYHHGKPVANMIGRESIPGDSQWLAYMSVDDVDSALEITEALGGSIHREAKDLPNRGRIGVAVDPQKAAFAMVTSPVGDPLDVKFVFNRWLGCELWTTDVSGASDFYTKLVGYSVNVVDVHEKVQYRLLASQGHRRGGIVEIPWSDAAPEWVPYIAVESILATVTKAQELGGKLLLEPDMSVKQGHIAIIADPAGAIFGIQQLR